VHRAVGGRHAELQSDPRARDPLEAGLEYRRQSLRARRRPADAVDLSGGEQALTEQGVIFAVFLPTPRRSRADEVDAPLDDHISNASADLLDEMDALDHTRFVIIATTNDHNGLRMRRASGVPWPSGAHVRSCLGRSFECAVRVVARGGVVIRSLAEALRALWTSRIEAQFLGPTFRRRGQDDAIAQRRDGSIGLRAQAYHSSWPALTALAAVC